MVTHHHKAPLLVAGIVFALVAIMHLLRIIYKVDIQVAGQAVSIQASYIGLVVSLILSIWMFKSVCCCHSKDKKLR